VNENPSVGQRLKTLLIGGARSPQDPTVFHKLSLIAFFAWVGLGADALTSSCYGPEEAFKVLKGHHFLAIFVAIGTALTILIISTSYSQIIELFPTGGGGYLVASKLLSPSLGMLSGCALLIDYVLTITVSIASGADALFSLFPPEWHQFRLPVAIVGVLVLTVLNLRGVKESVLPLVPLFLIFIITHIVAIVYALASHLLNFPQVAADTVREVQTTHAQLGFFGMIFLILHAYSMGAGTYTGIEAVSNGIPILREPKVQTAKRTMRYMSGSLAFLVLGLMLAYLLYGVEPQKGKTLNAVLLESVTAGWATAWSSGFVWVTLVSEAVLLLVAAQTGFLDGPRVLSYMALDRWMPTRFSALSDRLVTQNGILLMGCASLAMMLLSRGFVGFLVVLYSINVFITFFLSQLGMVRHWWGARASEAGWKKKLLINGFGFTATGFILCMVVILKFNQGGWITILVTTVLVTGALLIKRHYKYTGRLLHRLNSLVTAVESSTGEPALPGGRVRTVPPEYDPKAKTAVLLVNGFGGLGLHTLFGVVRLFGDVFENFVFVNIGVVDAGAFKGVAEIEHLRTRSKQEADRYVEFMRRNGYYAEAVTSVAIDIVEEVTQLAPKVLARFPHAVFFGGQLVFARDSFLSRWLHNYTAFAIQRRFYHQGIPIVILPVRV
jgi:amino acid transporter